VGPEKLEFCPYKTVNKCDDMYIRLDTIPLRWTDGQTDGIAKAVLRSA